MGDARGDDEDARARSPSVGARREARTLAFVNERGAFWLSPGRDEIAMEDVDLSNGDRAPPADGYGESEASRCAGGAPAASASLRGRNRWCTRRARDAISGAVALALCQNRPVLLEGPAGCGKSAVLEEVAHVTGNGDFVTLHPDAQTDLEISSRGVRLQRRAGRV